MNELLFGYNTNGFAHHKLLDALTILSDLEYNSVAITLDYHVLDPFDRDGLRQQIPAVRRALVPLRAGAAIETGARFLLDPTRKHQPTLLSHSEKDRGERFEFLSRAVDVAAELGIGVVSFWSGQPDRSASADSLMKRLVQGCKRLCEYTAGKTVRLAFEPEPGMFIDTIDKFADLFERVNHPAFGLTLDIGHLHCMGEVPMEPHLRRWKDVLWNVHIEDMKRGVHDHLMFGDGEIDFPPVLRCLREIGYAGGVHVELSRHSHDAVETARRAIALLRSW